jgi:hypothetical protein
MSKIKTLKVVQIIFVVCLVSYLILLICTKFNLVHDVDEISLLWGMTFGSLLTASIIIYAIYGLIKIKSLGKVDWVCFVISVLLILLWIYQSTIGVQKVISQNELTPETLNSSQGTLPTISGLLGNYDHTNYTGITSGYVNTPLVLANRLSVFGLSARPNYSNFTDLIRDIRSQNIGNVRIVGNINVGGISGYEVSVLGISGAWVEKNSILYTYYFNKPGPLSATDKQQLATIKVGQ